MWDGCVAGISAGLGMGVMSEGEGVAKLGVTQLLYYRRLAVWHKAIGNIMHFLACITPNTADYVEIYP